MIKLDVSAPVPKAADGQTPPRLHRTVGRRLLAAAVAALGALWAVPEAFGLRRLVPQAGRPQPLKQKDRSSHRKAQR